MYVLKATRSLAHIYIYICRRGPIRRETLYPIVSNQDLLLAVEAAVFPQRSVVTVVAVTVHAPNIL